MLAAGLIFAGTYAVIAIGHLPGFRVDRTGAAIIGATLMVAFNVLTLQEAYAAVDFDTIVLLFGMMIVVANLRLSGFFRAVSARVIAHAHRPLLLLAAIVFVSGVLSAFFVNDTICLVLTPLVLELSAAMRRKPVPFLLAVAMGSNAGSVATITGNPQNMMIGSFSGIAYTSFLMALAPVALAAMALTVVVITAAYWKEFRLEERVEVEQPRVRVHRPLFVKSVSAAAAMLVLFFAGWPVPMAAMVAAAVLLLTRRLKPERIYHEIDWSLLVLFIGLFIVVGGIEKTDLAKEFYARASGGALADVWAFSTVAAVLSNVVSNVPAVLMFKPLIAHLADPQRAWLVLAMASTLAGNLTLIGSVANLIVVHRARNEVRIGFWEYFKVGAPLGVLTIVAGVLLLR
ncbi:MAG: anion transporter [bacterium]|jgi:Na+/H+ antiporter NhaD/arsenite permease-like protein